MAKYKVIAVGDVCVQFRNSDGIMVRGRYYGRDDNRQPITRTVNGQQIHGEIVEVSPLNSTDLMRAKKREELIVEEATHEDLSTYSE